MKINWKVLILSFIFVHLAAFIGSSVTNPNTDWYNSIKPSITPAGWVFGVVWTILFLLIWLSLYIAWVKSGRKKKIKVFWIFAINLVLNALWSYLFFGVQKPVWAFFELIVLWFSIVFMIVLLRKINKVSSWMLVPYLLWVSFASVLNYLAAFG